MGGGQQRGDQTPRALGSATVTVTAAEPLCAPAAVPTTSRWWVAGLLVVTGLAGALRCVNLGALSLWVDEGLTVADSRLPWTQVLGLHGAYAAHPPLYFALVKATAVLVGDLSAGRVVSALAGTLTVPILSALVARLAGRTAALLAALAWAVCPLALWYSREGRPYAPMTLLVAASYLALVAQLQGGRRPWLLAYLGATTLALYTEESALFALAPQAVLLLSAARGDRHAVAPLAGAGLAAVLLYLPWLPQLLHAAPATSAQAQFALTPVAVSGVARGLLGLDAPQAVFAGGLAPPWVWAGGALGRIALVLVGLAAGAMGLAVLAHRGRLALGLGLALGPGVVLLAALVSLRLPSFAPRTVLPATLGWTLLLGAALGRASTTPRGWLAGALVTLTLLASVATDAALASGAYKQHWRALAADTAVAAHLGGPILTYPTVAGTLLGLYQPTLHPPRTFPIADGGSLPSATLHSGRVWLAYPAGTGEARLIAALQAHSYVRLLHLYYPYPLYLDLYARPGTPLGSPLPAAPWRLVRGGALIENATGDNPPLLGDAEKREEIAYADRPAAPGRLYEVVTTGRAAPGGGAGVVFLECLGDGQAFMRVAPDGAGAVVPADGAAHVLRVAVLCPAGTTAIRVDLRAEGHGPVRFRATRLVMVVPTSGARRRS